jgi:hypothetical protein
MYPNPFRFRTGAEIYELVGSSQEEGLTQEEHSRQKGHRSDWNDGGGLGIVTASLKTIFWTHSH